MNKYRHEYKYLIDSGQKQILVMKAVGLLQRDPHVKDDGKYIIRSLYFDDYRDTCFYENERGTDPRAKFRMRYYNDSADGVHLEKKSKRRGMTLKESCLLSADEAQRLTAGEYIVMESGMPDIKKKLLLELQTKSLLPKVIVTYERMPFVYTAGNVRITFDADITSSNQTERFLTHDYRQRPILPAGQSILEVKWDELLPLHIKSVMQLDTLQWSAFSKYYYCRAISL